MERYVTNLIGAEPAKRPDLAKAASPITYVGNKGPAFLVMHGDKDQIVPFAQSKVFCERLKANGIRCSFVVIPGGDHNFYSSKIEQQVGEFFDKTVKSNQGSPQKK